MEPFATNEQLEENQERHEVELTVEPQEEEEEPTRRGKKRRAESGGETRDDATVAKRICFEPMTDPTSGTCIHSSGPANPHSERANTEEVIDVESVSLTKVGGCLEGEQKGEIKVRGTEEGSMYEEAEDSADEIIDVDGDTDGGTDLDSDTDGCREKAGTGRTLPFLSHCVSTPSPPAQEGSRGLTGSREDEDIDVIGDSSPLPEPVIVSWTESSDKEDGDEDIDVVGEKTDYASSVVFTIVNKGELVSYKSQ